MVGLETIGGRLVELSSPHAGGPLSALVPVLLEAQARGEPVAWITLSGSTFFPPDLAAAGIDLDVLPVVVVADAITGCRAADELLRSGGFAVIVLDLVELGANARISIPAQTRLVGLARRHHTALVCLTRKPRSALSLGSLVSLRAESTLESVPRAGGMRLAIETLKDKRAGPGWRHAEIHRGPDGLY